MMLKTTTILVVVFAFVGCDNDFETIGTDIIGEPGFNAELYDQALITVKNNNLGPVQTNGLPVNLLGFYKDEVFGSQTASVLTQLNLSSADPDFGNNPVLDSVILTIPYFHTQVEATENEEGRYELDSIYGNSPIKLSIIQSNLFLTDYDPETEFEQRQKYYSNMQPQIESNLGTILFETDNFVPSAEAVFEYGLNEEGEEDTLRLPPRMRISLPTEFFKENIIDNEGTAVLATNNNFKNFFRGLYFKAEAVNNEGNLMILEFQQPDAGITLYYSSENDSEDADEETVQGSYQLNFGSPQQPATIVNIFDQEVPEFSNENLYLKGGEGSMSIIELFAGVDSDGDGASDELEFIRGNNWLVNEANLEFYVNKDLASGLNEPERVYLYNLSTGQPLIDYYVLQNGAVATDNQGVPIIDGNHSRRIVSEEDEGKVFYSIRITEHINRILNGEADNVKLGLVVSQNISITSNAAVLESEVPEIDRIPTNSIITPEGTILYGPEAENEEKQLKLRIYYSEAKN